MTRTHTSGDESTASAAGATHVVVGGGRVGAGIAERLRAAGYAATAVDDRPLDRERAQTAPTESERTPRPVGDSAGDGPSRDGGTPRDEDARRTGDTPGAVVRADDGPALGPVAPGDGVSTDPLDTPGVDGASTLILATPSDRRNFMLAQLARARFGTPRTVVLVHDDRRCEPLAEAGHEPLCVTGTLADRLVGDV